MTDNKIVKALDYCSCEIPFCAICPYCDKDNDFCREDLHKDALDLINRQKAEIEKVKPIHNSFERELECAKQEAIKEFAKRLKEQKYQSSDWSRGEHPFVVEEDDIDELVQEMVGDENGTVY